MFDIRTIDVPPEIDAALNHALTEALRPQGSAGRFNLTLMLLLENLTSGVTSGKDFDEGNCHIQVQGVTCQSFQNQGIPAQKGIDWSEFGSKTARPPLPRKNS